MKIGYSLFLTTLLVLPAIGFAFREDQPQNYPYVQSGLEGVFYARGVPAANQGLQGTTDIFRVEGEKDQHLDHYDWYALGGVVLGWSPMAGQVAVLAQFHSPTANGDKHLELAFYLGGKLLRQWTIEDLAKLGLKVKYTPMGRQADFHVVGCVQVPNTNDYDFVIKGQGCEYAFDILTGELRK